MRRLIAPLVLSVGLCSLAFGATSALAVAPTISQMGVSGVTTEAAVLEGAVNPQGKATGYRFEYGLVDCEVGPCTKTPVPDGVLAKAEAPVAVKAPVKGLTPGTTYHFRVIAKNGDGETKGPDATFMTYLPPQEFEPCPNDALRKDNPASARIEYSSANLPDCRAYEQASPLDKNAGDTTGTVPFVRAALGGGGITFLSSSGFPGGEGSQELPAYLATRGTGWTTQGLLPPAEFGQNANVLGWTPDFTDVYSFATQLGEPQETTLLTRPGGGGEQTQIFDHAAGPRPFFAGASADGDEVIFESKVALLPAAVEGKSNVYFWERASKELSLAGVMNDGEAPTQGAFAGSYDWINAVGAESLKKALSEGGAARNYYTQDQHAISTDGQVVYFTAAGTGQLYMRLNPGEKQSKVDLGGNCTEAALACTVNVSATQRTPADPAGTRPAAFLAASADGTRLVFLSSSEKLTNNANTGPEQEPAAIERADIADGKGRAPVLFTHASGLAVDATHTYWVNLDTGTIARAKLNGTGVEPEFIVPIELETEPGVFVPPNPKAVAVIDGFIYWTSPGEEEGEGTIGRAKLNGDGPASDIEHDFIEGAGNPQGVTANATHVYWTNSAYKKGNLPSSIGRAEASDGGEVAVKFFEVPGTGRRDLTEIEVDTGHIYWMTLNDPSSRISRLDFSANESTYKSIFIDLGGELVFQGGHGLALQGARIYWSTQTTELIGRAKLNGAEPASEVELEWIKDANHPQGVAADATSVYWTTNGNSPPNPGNDLYRYDADTKTLIALAPDSSSTNGAEVRGVLGTSKDATYVYFAANGVPDGTIGSPNARGESAAAGSCPVDFGSSAKGLCNLYLAQGGKVRFITRLETGGNEFKTDAANWASTPTGVFPNGDFQKTARVSPDGQTLLFRSQRQLTDYENEGIAQLYLYRTDDGEIRCVSCNPTGMAPSKEGQAAFGGISPAAIIPARPASTLTHNLSADGDRVFFETTDALVGADVNGLVKCPLRGALLQKFPACTDVYEWEAAGTGTCEASEAVADGGCLYLLSTGLGTEPAMIADASGDGKDVFFFSRSQLVGQDEDLLVDVYDARVEGGLAAQNQPPPDPCLSTDACHPRLPGPPDVPNPPKFSGPGNPTSKPKPRCAKGKHRVKGRCVAKKRKAKKQGKGAKGKANAKGRRGR